VVIVDTSAWIEFFRDGRPDVVGKVHRYLDRDEVGIGDLIYGEIMQGVRSDAERNTLSGLLMALARYDMAGFAMAEKSAANCRLLRSKGVTVRKTIVVLIGTFCAENGLPLVHCDSDFDHMAEYIGLTIA